MMTFVKDYIFPLLWTSMFYPLYSSPNSLHRKMTCPSTTILAGTDVKIGMEMHPVACDRLKNFGVLKNYNLDKCSEPSVLNASIQMMNRSKSVSITWVQQHTDVRCYSYEIFLLDVEQRMKDVYKTDMFYISNWCFQFQIQSGSPKMKENINYNFECIESIPETEAYLINTTLWKLPRKTLSSSEKTNCGRNQCYLLKDLLRIGPAPQDNYKFEEECLCWDKSNVTMEILEENEYGRSLRTLMTNSNPYAKMLYFKVYEMNDTEERIAFEKDIQLRKPEVQQVIQVEFALSCGSYTTEIMYLCDGSAERTRYKSRCAGRYISEFVVACKPEVPRKPLHDITVIAIIASVLLGNMIVLTTLILIRVCRRKCYSNVQTESSDSDVFRCNNQLDLVRLEILNPVPHRNKAEDEINFEDKQPLTGTERKVMLLCDQDHMDQHQKHILNLLVSLLKSLEITVYGYEESVLFSNWLTLADMACNDDVTNFMYIASSVDDLTNEGNDLLQSSQHWLFTNTVMTNLRICHAQEKKFNVHIICFHESEAPIIRNFIDKYKLCLNVNDLRKNTFIYCLGKHLEETSFNMDALLFLLSRIMKCKSDDFENRISYDTKLSLQNLKTVFENDFNMCVSNL